MIEAVILDLGNVLAFHDNEKLFAVMAQTFGVTADTIRERLDAPLWKAVNTGQLPGNALLHELNKRLQANVSPDVWFRTWNCHFTLHHEMVREVEALVGRVKLVLLSNTHDQHFAYLRPLLPVLERFDGLALSYEVGAVKPERLIYERAIELADRKPEACVFFDDVERFAEGARAAGMAARVFTTASQFRDDLQQLPLTSVGFH